MAFLSPSSLWHKGSFYMVMVSLLLLVLLGGVGGGGPLVVLVQASLVSESSIQQCTNDGESPLECGQKLVVSLSIPAGLKPGAESLNFLNTATNSSSNETVSFKPIAMTVSRSEMYYRYPLTYAANFNGNPYEQVIKKSVAAPCDDSATSKATCGLQYTPQMELIPYSQGYCCSCGFCAGIKVCSANARSNLACDLLGAYGSASCLRFGDESFSGYSLGPARTWFTIDLKFSRNTTDDGGEETTTITLSPSVLQAADNNFGVMAELIGTFSPSVEPANLEQSMLFIPVPTTAVAVPESSYMVLPLTMVTLDGSECNKVGVSYSGFNGQGNRCDMEVGSCLKNQLSQLAADDQKRIASGMAPLYSLSRYGENAGLSYMEKDGQAGVDKFLLLPSVAPPNTLITVDISADSLQYVISVADGNITEARMNNDTVTSMSNGAVMHVSVENTGKITASYTLSIVNCTGGVIPIPGRHVSLNPGSTESFSFDVYCQERMNGDAHCDVGLYNALAEMVDQKTVTWYLQDYIETNGAQGDRVDEDGPVVVTTGTGDCSSCSFVNIVCTIKYRCGLKIGGLLGLLGGLGGGLVLLFLFRSQVFGLIKKLLSCCCGGSSSSSSSSHEGRQRRRRREKAKGREAHSLSSSTTTATTARSSFREPIRHQRMEMREDGEDEDVCPYGNPIKKPKMMKRLSHHPHHLSSAAESQGWEREGVEFVRGRCGSNPSLLASLAASGVQTSGRSDGENGESMRLALSSPTSAAFSQALPLFTSQRRDLAASLSLREPMAVSGRDQPNFSYRRAV